MKETIPHVAHASTLIQLIKDLVHEIKKTSGVGSTLSIVLARATSRLALLHSLVMLRIFEWQPHNLLLYMRNLL